MAGKRGNPYHDAKGLFSTASSDADGKPDRGTAAFKGMIKEGMKADAGKEQTRFQKFMQKKREQLAKERAKSVKQAQETERLKQQAQTLLKEMQRPKSTPEQREKRRASHWRKTGVSSSTVSWMKKNGFL